MTRTANLGGIAARWTKAALLTGVLMAGLAGCLTVADDEGPILSMELFWDEETGNDFSGGTCDSADVDRMAWTLLDADGDEVASHTDETDADSQPCFNAIDIIDPGPGNYELEISGLDDDGRELWTATCSDMDVLRFDVSYNCEIERD